MKVAISATANGWNAPIDDRFGRAKGFFVCDTESDQASYIDNLKNVDTGHGAGTSTAQAVIETGAKIVITAKIGPKAGSSLKAGGVRVFECGDASTIKIAFERFKNGELEETNV